MVAVAGAVPFQIGLHAQGCPRAEAIFQTGTQAHYPAVHARPVGVLAALDAEKEIGLGCRGQAHAATNPGSDPGCCSCRRQAISGSTGYRPPPRPGRIGARYRGRPGQRCRSSRRCDRPFRPWKAPDASQIVADRWRILGAGVDKEANARSRRASSLRRNGTPPIRTSLASVRLTGLLSCSTDMENDADHRFRASILFR